MLKVRLRQVFLVYSYANKSWRRKIVHLSSRMRDFFFPDELMYPDGVNQCSFSFIMCTPAVSGKQPLGMGFGPNLGWDWDLVYLPSGPSYNIVVILYKYRTVVQIVQLLSNSDTLF